MATLKDSESSDPSSPTPAELSRINRRSRKNSVQTACERCRRRKIKCSGLPGPCATCLNLGTACHDPGKRKDRAQSLLENRIQRLEILAAHERAAAQPERTHSLPYRSTPQEALALHIQTQDLTNYQRHGMIATTDNSPMDVFAGSISPACYSDVGPDLAPWQTVDYQQSNSDMTATPNPLVHKRSHTFPTVTTDDFDWNQEGDIPISAGAFSDIPSIEVTSPGCSRPQSPGYYTDRAGSPAGISIPYSSPRFCQNDEELCEPNPDILRTPPLSAVGNRPQDGQIDYYADYLSPIDRPPTLSRRSSTASSAMDSIQGEVSPQYFTRPHRSHTLPSTFGQNIFTDQDRLNITASSPRTRNYLQIYCQQVHSEYPILNPGALLMNNSKNAISTCQVLLAAAIGALVHHQSRSLSSPYVRLAMSLSSEIDFWSSISGVHCALLLAIYCFYEESLSFKDELDHEDPQRLHIAQSLHPHVNLWLHSCQICATCIDLGLSLGFLSGLDPISLPSKPSREFDFFPETDSEREMEVVYKNTFKVVYKLDKNISSLKQRPRSIHDRDLHPDLVHNFMLTTLGV